MRRYTPVEILQAGADDTRATHAHLYLELERLQAALCWRWHRANLDPDVPLLDGEERLPTYPAGPAFGGNAIAIPARPVHLVRLTPAGRALYRIGCQVALIERAQLVHRVLDARAAVDAAATMLTPQQRHALTAAALATAAAAEHRASPRPSTAVTSDAWAVRIPGTGTWATPPAPVLNEHDLTTTTHHREVLRHA